MNRLIHLKKLNPKKLLLLSLVVILISITALTANAQSDNKSLSAPTEDGPVEVYIDIFNVSIDSIDERNETFEVDAVLYGTWFDARQAFDPATAGTEIKIYQGEAAVEILKTDIWWPDFEIYDSRGPRERLQTTVTVDADGWVSYTERFRAFITQPFFLGDFPFDSHNISLTIGPFYYTNDEVVFIDDSEERENLTWESNEWVIHSPQSYVGSSQDDDEGLMYPSTTLEFEISRISGYYISNFIIPLILIVAISWAVFWMDFENMHLADRLSVSFTSVLTVVAFDFVTSDNLPKLSYPTLMDSYLTISYFILAITVLENVIVYSISKKNQAQALRIEKVARIILPIVYFIALFLAT